jgi:small neutral amino acid transporter SnatA (MarC family)
MKESTIISIFFMAIGLFSIIASLTGWYYFFNHRKARIFLKFLGRKGVRIFYLMLGFALFSFGFLALTGIINLE